MDNYQTSRFPSFNTQFQHPWNEREAEVIAANVSAQQGEWHRPRNGQIHLKLFFYSPRQRINITIGILGLENGSKNYKANQLLLRALTATVTCTNCGQPHHISKCPAPRNETAIDRNKENYMKQKNASLTHKATAPASKSFGSRSTNNRKGSKSAKSSKPSNRRDKFRPPDRPSETKRMIFTQSGGEKLYTWNASRKQWVPDVLPPSGLSVATPQGTAPGPDTAFRAQLAELQRQAHLWTNNPL
jgi:hypothetical protein